MHFVIIQLHYILLGVHYGTIHLSLTNALCDHAKTWIERSVAAWTWTESSTYGSIAGVRRTSKWSSTTRASPAVLRPSTWPSSRASCTVCSRATSSSSSSTATSPATTSSGASWVVIRRSTTGTFWTSTSTCERPVDTQVNSSCGVLVRVWVCCFSQARCRWLTSTRPTPSCASSSGRTTTTVASVEARSCEVFACSGCPTFPGSPPALNSSPTSCIWRLSRWRSTASRSGTATGRWASVRTRTRAVVSPLLSLIWSFTSLFRLCCTVAKMAFEQQDTCLYISSFVFVIESQAFTHFFHCLSDHVHVQCVLLLFSKTGNTIDYFSLSFSRKKYLQSITYVSFFVVGIMRGLPRVGVFYAQADFPCIRTWLVCVFSVLVLPVHRFELSVLPFFVFSYWKSNAPCVTVLCRCLLAKQNTPETLNEMRVATHWVYIYMYKVQLH